MLYTPIISCFIEDILNKYFRSNFSSSAVYCYHYVTEIIYTGILTIS